MEAPNPQDTGRWGERLATVLDLDGDRANELLVGAPAEDIGDRSDVGVVYLLDGRTRALRYELNSPELQSFGGGFGFYIQALGDVNGDGREDIAVGEPFKNVTADGDPCPPAEPCNFGQGKAWVFSAATGRLLYALNNPNPQPEAATGFGGRIGRAGDITGDGHSEVIVGAAGNDFPAGCGEEFPVPAGCRVNEGEAFIFDGATGELLRTLRLPAEDRPAAPCEANCGALGVTVQGLGDTDGDGVTDQLVASRYIDGEPRGRMYLFSGETGALLRKIDNPQPQCCSSFGFQDVAPGAPGDVNGDGFADIYANGFSHDVAGRSAQGRAWVFSGRAASSGSPATPFSTPLYTLDDPSPTAGGQFGWSMDKTDYNKDGRPDLYVGASPHHVQGADQNGGSYVFDGRNGALLKALDLPQADRQPSPGPPATPNFGPNLGWGLAAPGDLNGDREPDYIAAAPYADVGSNQDQGRVYFFNSRVDGGLRSQAALPGFAGCSSRTANLISGSAVGNTIMGTVAADRIFAGTGNDTVDALAGDDCVDLGSGTDRGQGGLGNDLVLGGLGTDRISGSSGNDRLRGNAGGDRIDAGRGNDRAFGDQGNDLIRASFGNDVLHGVSGNDRLFGSRGRDRVNGGSGRDSISAGSSNDRVAGDAGNDRINGNSGNDRLTGNSGADRVEGGSGRDRIRAGSGSDRIAARDGQRDRIDCGSGRRDRVSADRIDVVSRNCEVVRRP